jgi:hypothetical protein
MREQNNSIFAGLLFVAIFIVGGYLAKIYITDDLIAEAESSKDWPSVQGKITESKIETSRKDKKTYYSLSITYEYEVNGKKYQSNDINIVDPSSSTSKASIKKTINKYPLHSIVKVYYDPDFPETTVLETGSDLLVWFLLRLPYLFMAIGVLLAFSVIKQILRFIF